MRSVSVLSQLFVQIVSNMGIYVIVVDLNLTIMFC